MKPFATEELFKLDGAIPLLRAVPYGVQHILAMFVANLAPIVIVAGAAGLGTDQTGSLIQSAMLIAGIGTLIQLFPLGRIGSGLPIVMGISFTFVTVLCGIVATYGYSTAIGAIMVGGIIEGVLGLFAKYWRRIISPIVAAVVVTSIGFSLLGVGATSFGGGSGVPDFGSPQNLALGTVSLVSCLVFQVLAKGKAKQLSVLFGLVIGYVVALFMGAVDFSGFAGMQLFALPQLMPFTPEFNLGAIVSVTLIFLVSATETIGDTSALTMVGLNREVKREGAHRLHRVRRLRQLAFGLLWLPAHHVVLAERGPGGHDEGGEPARHRHRSRHHGAGGVFAGHQRGVLVAARGGAGRLHHHDVRQHHRERLPDDRACRLHAAQHHHRRAVAGRGHRLHAGVGAVRGVPRDRAERVRAELRGRGVSGGRGGEPRAAAGSAGGGCARRGALRVCNQSG